jgi:hypothetical protein
MVYKLAKRFIQIRECELEKNGVQNFRQIDFSFLPKESDFSEKKFFFIFKVYIFYAFFS